MEEELAGLRLEPGVLLVLGFLLGRLDPATLNDEEKLREWMRFWRLSTGRRARPR